MKQCPACRSQYTDDTLQFCLQDGTPLETIAVDPQEGVWRDVSPEEETVVSERRPAPPPVVPPESARQAEAPRPTEHIRRTEPVHERRPARRTGLLVFASVVGTLLLLSILGAAIWMFTRNNRQETARDARVNVNVARNAEPKPSPTTTPSQSPASNSVNVNTETSSSVPTAAETSREVGQAVSDWVADTESLDIDNLVQRYAGTVDYYRTSGASRDAVRRDKERAFSLYDSVKFDISNMEITPGKTPDTATAEFDKAWVFDGENHSEGKVRSRLNLKKVDGEWLITGERDIKVY